MSNNDMDMTILHLCIILPIILDLFIVHLEDHGCVVMKIKL